MGDILNRVVTTTCKLCGETNEFARPDIDLFGEYIRAHMHNHREPEAQLIAARAAATLSMAFVNDLRRATDETF